MAAGKLLRPTVNRTLPYSEERRMFPQVLPRAHRFALFKLRSFQENQSETRKCVRESSGSKREFYTSSIAAEFETGYCGVRYLSFNKVITGAWGGLQTFDYSERKCLDVI